MVHRRQAAGGGIIVEIPPQRLAGWLVRFAAHHGEVQLVDQNLSTTSFQAANGTNITLLTPFAPLTVTHHDPVENILAHIDQLAPIAMIATRSGAYSVGVCADGKVLSSSTDRQYVQGRSAAGGWSQQRFARRRGNQQRSSFAAAAEAAHHMFSTYDGSFGGLLLAGSRAATDTVLADPRLQHIAQLPRRVIRDIGPPRRRVLDELAERALTLEITVVDADATAEKHT